jgi:hypothetical protein
MLFPERARAARSRRVARSRPREPRQRRGLADEVDDRGRVAVEPVWKSNLLSDFNVSVCGRFDASSSSMLREFDESNRFVQKSAESTSI